MPRGEEALHLANHARRRGRNYVGLSRGGFGESQPSEQNRQFNMLQLQGSQPRQFRVQMLPRAGERLMTTFGFRLQTLAEFLWRAGQQPLVEFVAILRN